MSGVALSPPRPPPRPPAPSASIKCESESVWSSRTALPNYGVPSQIYATPKIGFIFKAPAFRATHSYQKRRRWRGAK